MLLQDCPAIIKKGKIKWRETDDNQHQDQIVQADRRKIQTTAQPFNFLTSELYRTTCSCGGLSG